MIGKLTITLLTLCAAIALPWGSQQQLRAGSAGILADSDGDFLPDSVEWAVLTNPSMPDSDEDQVPDFVEVVQRVAPRQAGHRLPLDQEMRIVVSGPQPGSGDSTAWIHLLVRVVGSGSDFTSLHSWFEFPGAPGVQFPFNMMSLGPAVIDIRDAGVQGLWMRMSVPLASTQALRNLAPASIHVESVIGNRTIHSSVPLINVEGTLATVVPFDARFALHSLEAVPGGLGGQSNRVCLLSLAEQSIGPGGSIYEVVHAECVDCNELECAPSCPNSVGWILVLPGGLGGLVSGY